MTERTGRGRMLAAVAILILTIAGVAWGTLALWPRTGGSSAVQTRTDGGANGVTFRATLEATSPAVRFTVELDTHTVDLTSYDLSSIRLEDSAGTRFAATDVAVVERGTHHVKAVFEFEPVSSAFATLIALDLAGVPERRLGFSL